MNIKYYHVIIFLNILFLNSFCAYTYEYKKQNHKHMTVLITAYNCEKWVEKNLDSVRNQSHDDYDVIYIDDASTDQTYESVCAYIQKYNLESKFKAIKNKKRRLKLYNLYHAIHQCDDNDIIVLLDGDDWYYHSNVFQKIYKTYQDNYTWMTYGKITNSNNYNKVEGERCPLKIVKNNLYRSSKWRYHHPRTFYAWLFKKIKKDDLCVRTISQYKNQFYPLVNDGAMMYPMLEMSGDHCAFISKVAYVRNTNNPESWKNSSSKIQLNRRFGREIKARKKYKPL
jgi:glycosyltransferase involved in cell wall biosynthesis